MARPKSVTIRLTPKQRTELKRLTGEEHAEVMFESVKTYRTGDIGSKATLANKTAPRHGGMKPKISPRGGGLKPKISPRGGGLKPKVSPRGSFSGPGRGRP